ncbi:hypothetical protein QT231_11665 [Halomonas sp. SpR1]|uniref:hypothetical protein n=1 Tax=Halomonas sp. SpR1 TaxID=3050462 RepID=UPI0027E464B2|nr:hypothetical protein [Halomonas sp. SpR1]MDQ7733358.1 hypothetical protein [Halomonas sp. SpR1]
MRRIGILKAERLVDLLNWIGFPAVGLYFICMLIFPWIDGGGEWDYVQDVWDRWQGLNVGMLAFISSVTAFNISRFNADKQREREFLASKAFLPEALSELVSYFKESASVFITGWELPVDQNQDIVLPVLPREYKVVFGNCIKHSEPDVGEYLSDILVKLQVHDARIRDFIIRARDETNVSPEKHNLISYLYRLGELYALVGKLFDYARSLQEFDASPLEWEDFRNAYFNLEIWSDEIRIDDQMNLEAFTKRTIDRENRDT